MKIKSSVYIIFILSLIGQKSWAQTQKISGIVTDEDDVPLLGVNVSVEGSSSSKGTTTDFDGLYEIEAPVKATLKYKYIGFKPLEKTIGSEDTINITLSENTEALDEVIVTAFNKKMTRNESTANVVSVSSEDIAKQKFTDAIQSLQGKVPGMRINASSGVPGTSSEIRIRGINSITASNDPLFVLDGMPINSGNIAQNPNRSSIDIFSLINPNDIENISVLKDASAVAPYGAEGANGVILVSTKSGKPGKTEYNLSLSSSFKSPALKGLEMMNSEQKLEGVLEGVWNSYGSGVNGTGEIESRDDLLDYAYEHINQVKTWVDDDRPNTNWQDIVEQKNQPSTDVNFSAKGGTEKSNFLFSLGYNNTQGTVLGTDFRRWNSLIKYSAELHEKLDLDFSANIANAAQNGLMERGEGAPFDNPNTVRYLATPWVTLFDDDGNVTPDRHIYDQTVFHNILYTAEHDINKNDITRAIPIANLNYALTDNLTFKSLFGIDYTIQNSKYYKNPVMGEGYDYNGRNEESTNQLYHYTTQNSLDYNFEIDNNHEFDITLLQEFNKYKNNFIEGYGENYPNDQINNLSGASANFNTTSTYDDQMSMRYIGLVNYNYRKKYLVNASYSYQGDSRFSKHYDSFYSLGLGWNIHKEVFSENIEDIDLLQLKIGYGLTGNAGIGRNQYQPLLSLEKYNNNPAGWITGYGTKAKWEKSHRMDAALDFSLFNSKISGTIGVFTNRTSDMLLNVPLPRSASFTEGEVIRNAGEMRNSGFELNLNTDVLTLSDFKWNIDLNISSLSNKVTSLPEDAEITTDRQIVKKGHKLYEWYLPEWAGVDPDNGLPLWYINRAENEETTSTYNKAQRVFTEANPLPKFNGALSMTFDYKNFFLESTLVFSGGHKIYSDRAEGFYRTSKLTGSISSVAALEGAWKEPGDNAEFPRFDLNDSRVSNAGEVSTHFLHKGDYGRLRDIGLGYTFHNLELSGLNINELALSLRGTNLFTWLSDSSYKFDPERPTDINGRYNFTTPPVKSITFNLNLNF